MGERGRRREPGPELTKPEFYRVARIGAAATLLLLLFVLAIADVIVPDYTLSPVTLAMILTVISGLLGVEILVSLFGNWFGGKK